jgi:predicted nucleic acid-binding protein
MSVVANTTPLIGLASIQRFQLLNGLFGEVHIAKAVYDEIMLAGVSKKTAVQEVSPSARLKTIQVKDRLAVDVLLDELDLGEAETIIVAREINADWVIMDKKKGRQKLTQLGLNKIGTVGILLKAKELGLVSVIKPELEKLQEHGFSLSQLVIDTVLHQAGE